MRKVLLVLLSIGLVLSGFLIVAGSVTGLELRSSDGDAGSLMDRDWSTGSASQSRDEGSRRVLTYDNRDFNSVKVSSAFELEISGGDEFAVEISIDKKWVKRLEVKQDRTELMIRLKSGLGWFDHPHAVARITLPVLTELDASGATDIRINDLKLSDFDLDVSGASKVRFVNCAITRMEVEASGASKLDFGQSDDLIEHLELECSGASRISLMERPARNVELDLSGASKLDILVDEGMLSGEASGASKINIYGTVKSSRINSSGASDINYHD